MKKTVFIVLFVFSVSMNMAVLATLGWHFWNSRNQQVQPSIPDATLNQDDVRRISNAWPRNRRAEMRQIRRQIRDKKLEVLELIAKNPGDLKAAEKEIDELVGLRAVMERKALTRISKIMESLPPEKRADFLRFLQTRACMRHGMGRGPGFGLRMRHGMGPGMGRRMRHGMGPGMGRGMGPVRGYETAPSTEVNGPDR